MPPTMTAPAVSEFPVKRTNTTTMILRRDVQASLFDGAIMHGYQYGQQLLETDQPHPEDAIPVPLLCLATELGNSREYHGLVLKLASQPNSPKHIYTVDMRGRGRSFESPVSGTDVHTDADDLINFLRCQQFASYRCTGLGAQCICDLSGRPQTPRSGAQTHSQ